MTTYFKVSLQQIQECKALDHLRKLLIKTPDKPIFLVQFDSQLSANALDQKALATIHMTQLYFQNEYFSSPKK